MKPALQLKVGQRLAMTPQLQHSIKMLQLSALELRTEIQQALDSNPMLEEDYQDDSLSDATGVDADHELRESDVTLDQVQLDAERDANATDTHLQEEHMPTESVLDVDFDAQFDPPVAPAANANNADSTMDFDSGNATPVSLQQHLLWQASVTTFSPVDRTIAETVINYIGEDGYLRSSLQEIHQILDNDDIELDEVQAVLRQIQNFDPEGVGARDLAECLSLQLRARVKQSTPCGVDAHSHNTGNGRQTTASIAKRIVEEHLDELATQDFKAIQRTLDISDAELADAVVLIQSLNPRPGYQVADTAAEYVIPDLLVRRWRGQWRVQLNSGAMPKLSITRAYDQVVSDSAESTKVKSAIQGTDKKEREYIREQISDARWFIKTIHHRNDTLLRVAEEIVRRQQGFFDHGESAMKPMVLKDIATALELHESTISRATTQKYMHTPTGVVELKFFFSASVGATEGDTHSATAIRSLIRQIIDAEPNKKPISDNKIATLLGEKNIAVARRTVAKYRESMNIPPSSQRKSL